MHVEPLAALAVRVGVISSEGFGLVCRGRGLGAAGTAGQQAVSALPVYVPV
jgi:hypothetical protein